jgi:hypothetical protein
MTQHCRTPGCIGGGATRLWCYVDRAEVDCRTLTITAHRCVHRDGGTLKNGERPRPSMRDTRLVCLMPSHDGKMTIVPSGYVFLRLWFGLLIRPSRCITASVLRLT